MTTWLDTLKPLAPSQPRFSDLGPQLTPVRGAAELYADAESVLLSAHAEAAEIVEDATIQAETLRAAAWQEGFHAGSVEARTSVDAELRAEWAVRQEALRSEIDVIAGDIGAAREALWRTQETEMVALALDIARQVIKTEVAENPAVIHAVLANALRRITDKDNVRVRVSVSDAPRVKEAREDLMEVVDGLRFIEIVADRRVGDGGCVIETNAGTIDAKIETQIAEVARALGVSDGE